MSSQRIYDVIPDFGRLYDAVRIYVVRRDLDFYVSEAERRAPNGGAVLDLGCGTGRMLLPLARAGHRVVGVDASSAMLDACREKLEQESADVRARVSLHEADARDFTLPRSESGVPFAIAPFRMFQHMITVDDQLRCLAAVKRALAPGGWFAFDVFNPNFAMMTADRSAETEDTTETPVGDGRFFRRTTRVLRIRWVDQVSEIELIYYVRDGNNVSRHVQSFDMRWFLPAELEHLLVRAGFTLEAMYGSLDRGPLTDDASEILVVARNAQVARS